MYVAKRCAKRLVFRATLSAIIFLNESKGLSKFSSLCEDVREHYCAP